MKKTALMYLTGLSENAYSYQNRQDKKYGGKIIKVQRSMEFDISQSYRRPGSFAFWIKKRCID
jgi:hypothetical protein